LKYHNPVIVKKVLNIFYNNPETVILFKENLDYVVVDNCIFRMSDQVDCIQRINGNPWFDNIRKTDSVLDIGANIGAITIPLAKLAKQVYAVEPLFSDELRKNIELNNLSNVKIIECGLGRDNTTERIQYGLNQASCKLMSIDSILKITDKIDFVKVDCEGAEWFIEPDQLIGIREIRMELHIRRNSKHSDLKKLKNLEQWLEKNNYLVNIKHNVQNAPHVDFTECMLLSASTRND
jgi:hypothetical protein